MIAILQPNNLSCRLGLAVFGVLICIWSARGATLIDYRLRVSHAADTLERLQASYADEDSSARENFSGDTIARLLEQLPAKETVTLGPQNVEVDNTWLHDSLSEFRKISGNRAMSAGALARIVIGCSSCLLSRRQSSAQDAGYCRANRGDTDPIGHVRRKRSGQQLAAG